MVTEKAIWIPHGQSIVEKARKVDESIWCNFEMALNKSRDSRYNAESCFRSIADHYS